MKIAKPKLFSTKFDKGNNDTCYKQNTSQQQCQKEESVVVLLSMPASSRSVVKSTRKLKQDWWKLLELLGVLIFKTIGLVLLIGIIAVGQVESLV